MKTLVNISLMLILAAILIIPVAVSHFVVVNGKGFGLVAGAKDQAEKMVNIIPNLTDFNGYVDFSPGVFEDGKYDDVITLRVFPRQKASYRGVYTVYNLDESKYLQVEIVSTGPQNKTDEVSFAKGLVNVSAQDSQPILLQNVNQGDTLLVVDNPYQYQEDERVLLTDEFVQVVAISDDGLVVTPLTKDHAKGEVVYNESIVFTPDRLLNPKTSVITIKPGSRVSVDITIEASPEMSPSKEASVQIPLIFKVNSLVQ